MSEPAPFFASLADGPEGGRAVWLRTIDGVRIRAGYWPGGALGTVVLLPGRTEYVEKYGRAARELLSRGWSVIVLDWRGQGLADRPLDDPMLGHVAQFSDYQHDLDAVLAFLRHEGGARGLRAPWMLLSHSMGGLIALRAVNRRLPFHAAVFSAPMWGIRVPLWHRPLADAMRLLPLSLPQDRGYAPTTSGKSYVLTAGFEGNQLTGDLAMWDYLRSHVEAEPALRLGGPSLGWLRSALRECAVQMRGPAPALPAIVALGSQENIVRPDPIHRRMAGWRAGRLEIYSGARHEVPMERPEIRTRFFDSAHRLFAEQAGKGAPAEEPAVSRRSSRRWLLSIRDRG